MTLRTARLAAAATALAVVAAPFATTPASAMICPDPLRPVCGTLGVVCQALEDNPKIPDCPPLG